MDNLSRSRTSSGWISLMFPGHDEQRLRGENNPASASGCPVRLPPKPHSPILRVSCPPTPRIRFTIWIGRLLTQQRGVADGKQRCYRGNSHSGNLLHSRHGRPVPTNRDPLQFVPTMPGLCEKSVPRNAETGRYPEKEFSPREGETHATPWLCGGKLRWKNSRKIAKSCAKRAGASALFGRRGESTPVFQHSDNPEPGPNRCWSLRLFLLSQTELLRF